MTTNDDRPASDARTLPRVGHPGPTTGMGPLLLLVGFLGTLGLGGLLGWAMASQADDDAFDRAIEVAFSEAPVQGTAVGRFHAPDGLLADGEARGYDAVEGLAVAITADDRAGTAMTALAVSFTGLRPDTTYPGHLHEAPCSADGGGHLMNDPAGPAEPGNEVWFTLETGADGAAIAHGNTVDWWLEPVERSVVVHDPDDKAKLLCIDLSFVDASSIA